MGMNHEGRGGGGEIRVPYTFSKGGHATDIQHFQKYIQE